MYDERHILERWLPFRLSLRRLLLLVEKDQIPAKVAMTKKDAYADKQCPKASTKYYGQEYERAKECRFGRDTRKVFNSKKMDMGDYLFDSRFAFSEAAKSAISTVIEDYRPRYAQYDRMVMHTGTGQVGMQKIGFFYNRKGLRDEYG
eukprot:Skav215635  [mRNA]  locus=scaffold736:31035:36601:+ [translate_table: standard]